MGVAVVKPYLCTPLYRNTKQLRTKKTFKNGHLVDLSLINKFFFANRGGYHASSSRTPNQISKSISYNTNHWGVALWRLPV
jgi:hypothetical protein